MHLRDRSGGNGFTEARKHLRDRLVEGCDNYSFRLCLRKRRQAVLKILQIARHGDADHVRTRGEELAELDVSRPSRVSARDSRPLVAAPRRSISRAILTGSTACGGSDDGSAKPNTPSRANT